MNHMGTVKMFIEGHRELLLRQRNGLQLVGLLLLFIILKERVEESSLIIIAASFRLVRKSLARSGLGAAWCVRAMGD